MIHLAPFALAQDVLPEKPGFYRRIVHEPVGVVLTVAPWNYPLLTAMNTIGTVQCCCWLVADCVSSTAVSLLPLLLLFLTHCLPPF